MTLDKLLLQVRRIAEHRELGAEKKIRATYKQCLKELKQFIGYEYATLAEDGKLTYDILAKKQAQARFLEEVQQHIDRVGVQIRGSFDHGVEHFVLCAAGQDPQRFPFLHPHGIADFFDQLHLFLYRLM